MDKKQDPMLDVRTSQDDMKEAVKKQQQVINKINQDRYQGLKTMEEVTESFDQKKGTFEEALPGRIVDIQKAIRGAHTSMQAMNNMNNMLANDLIGASDELEQLKYLYFQASTHLQVLTKMLIDQGTITEDGFKEEWDKAIADIQATTEGQK